ncbi:hypothetical protein HAX54_039660 [Datura stramonium]|uniref:Uncharacterized protein n=1 Tax=Datura stramonium TaxID=4076 RepID=A0ABS8SJ48_DATST|nr:hypothetical protein [Datura stramonium]
MSSSGWHLPSPDRKTKRRNIPKDSAENPTLRQQKEGSYPALGRNSGILASPRLQQKKKQSCPTTTSPEFSRVRRQSVKRPKNQALQKRDCKQTQPSARVDEELDHWHRYAIATTEQPSPVSVLDAAFYEEDSPSPVKKKTTAFRVEDAADELWYLDCRTTHLARG